MDGIPDFQNLPPEVRKVIEERLRQMERLPVPGRAYLTSQETSSEPEDSWNGHPCRGRAATTNRSRRSATWPRDTPLVRPPAHILPITPAPLKEAKTTLKLPGSASNICVGGGGRFLIFHLPQQRQLAIFDVNEAKVVKYLPVAEDNILFAAGMDKLMVILPDKQLIQRWNLRTLEREVTAQLPINEKIYTVAMGSASDGALILGGPGLNGHAGLPLRFLDIQTLREAESSDQKGNGGMVGTHPQYPHQMRVSADGRTIGMWKRGAVADGVPDRVARRI